MINAVVDPYSRDFDLLQTVDSCISLNEILRLLPLTIEKKEEWMRPSVLTDNVIVTLLNWLLVPSKRKDIEVG